MRLILENNKSIHFKTIWVGNSQQDRHIVLLSDDLNFIEEALESIRNYTAKIDPQNPLNITKFKPIKDYFYDTKIDSKWEYFVEIDDVLPKTVKIFYNVNLIRSNCHGFAMQVSGMNATPSCIYFFDPNDEAFEKASLENLQSGDYVYLKSGDHSFIFLNHQICLSTNGIGNKLKIYPTAKVLRTYSYSSKSLIDEKKSNGRIIEIFRNNRDLNHNYLKYYSTLTSYLEKLFKIYRDYKEGEILKKNDPLFTMDNYFPSFPISSHEITYKEIAVELNQCVLEAQADSNLSRDDLSELEYLYKECMYRMHPDILGFQLVKSITEKPYVPILGKEKYSLNSKKIKSNKKYDLYQKIKKREQLECLKMLMLIATVTSITALVLMDYC